MRFFLLLTACCLLQIPGSRLLAQIPQTLFQRSGGTRTPTYAEVIRWWKAADAASPLLRLQTEGPTDAGEPLHLALLSADGDFDPAAARRKGKTILFVLNGIHPGEPDGIDASMLLAEDYLRGRKPLPKNVLVALVPVYNIGGALNRSTHYRVDQNGPEAFGFRGNGQNLDLNRDFIKMDSRNAQSFARLFHRLDPDVFVDNHVSNGADYQHVMTLLTSQHNKLGGPAGAFLEQEFEPALYREMEKRGFPLVPYVNHFRETPDSGWSQFWDSPRYSSGFATLWHTFSFVPETHMLKPYAQRVAATKALMETFIGFMEGNGSRLRSLRAAARQAAAQAPQFPIAWKWMPGPFKEITFHGYRAGKKPSEVSGQPRLFYDRSQPFTATVPFYNVFQDTLRVTAPRAYVLPQGWWPVADRLRTAGVELIPLKRDTVLEVEAYRIEGYTAAPRPFEGHHLNRGVTVSKSSVRQAFRKGDYLIPLTARSARFLVETLEPQGEDSYFAWNFFDPILQQKEGYSDYSFEDTAARWLREQPELRRKLEERRSADSAFARNGRAQLDFVFRSSPYYEPAHNRYPVYRLMK